MVGAQSATFSASPAHTAHPATAAAAYLLAADKDLHFQISSVAGHPHGAVTVVWVLLGGNILLVEVGQRDVQDLLWHILQQSRIRRAAGGEAALACSGATATARRR